MINIIVYSPQGRILRTVTCPEELAPLQVITGESWMEAPEGAGDAGYYVSEGRVVPRPEMPAAVDKPSLQANALENATITGPEGAAVTVAGPYPGSGVMDADGIAFVTNYPGTYTVRMELFPYLPWEGKIEAL